MPEIDGPAEMLPELERLKRQIGMVINYAISKLYFSYLPACVAEARVAL
jgi:hypothetical protein